MSMDVLKAILQVCFDSGQSNMLSVPVLVSKKGLWVTSDNP